jgi:hypothetical protein
MNQSAVDEFEVALGHRARQVETALLDHARRACARRRNREAGAICWRPCAMVC